MNTREKLAKYAVGIPNILLPKKGLDYNKFSAVACDQFTSDEAYWERVEKHVGDAPSALGLMLPEVYLENGSDVSTKMAAIGENMKKYVANGTLEDIGECFVYVERGTTTGMRKGLVVALDLDCYDYTGKSNALIRSTEKTVVDRLPPRIDIRKKASLEMPHILVLVDDENDVLLGKTQAYCKDSTPLYDFDLMEDGGHITGYRVDGKGFDIVADSLEGLANNTNILFAMGDGNHSFAAAKECWEQIKATLSPEERENHVARYAIAEIINLRDEACMVEPIHRIVFGVTKEKLEAELNIDTDNLPPLQELQPKLDEWIKNNPGTKLDYIHGEKETRELAKDGNAVAIVYKEFDKSTLFETVERDGVLVRKTFSMGEARDKRYYLECRTIV